MTLPTARLGRAFALFACLAAAGCADKPLPVKEYKGVPVAGRVLLSGKPIKPKPDETIHVAFIMIEGEEAEKAAFSTEVKPEDGTFAINGSSGLGIPAGRYKVTISSSSYGGSSDDRFEERFGASASRLIAEVTGDPGQTFEINLDKHTVKKSK